MTRTLRELRAQLRTMLLMVLLAIFGLAVGAYLVVHQRIVWPSWVPFVGHQDFILNAPVSAVSGVLPGQGQAKSHRLGDCLAAVRMASNCRCVNPRVGDWARTWGRRTYSAGECSRTPSITHVR